MAENWLRFIEMTTFTREWERQDLTIDDLAALQLAIADGPTRYPVIAGTGGLRKIRFAGHSGKGKSGGQRVCYAYYTMHGAVLLVTVFAKSVKANLSAKEKATAARLIARVENDLDEGRF